VEQRRVMLVTGGARGIGAATALMAAARGYDLCLGYRAEAARAEAVAAAAAQAGARVEPVQADLGSEAGVTHLFTALDRAFGRLDVLVNNAGTVGEAARLADVAGETIAEVLAVNVAGALLCAREAVRRMSRARGGRGGSIVTVSSRAAALGGAGEWVHYAASKGAVDAFTIGLAREVAAEGIRVNAVSPGLIDTEIHARAGMPDRIGRLAPGVPMGRAGTPEEVAEAILWLASDAASFVTGAVLPVCGGR